MQPSFSQKIDGSSGMAVSYSGHSSIKSVPPRPSSAPVAAHAPVTIGSVPRPMSAMGHAYVMPTHVVPTTTTTTQPLGEASSAMSPTHTRAPSCPGAYSGGFPPWDTSCQESVPEGAAVCPPANQSQGGWA